MTLYLFVFNFSAKVVATHSILVGSKSPFCFPIDSRAGSQTTTRSNLQRQSLPRMFFSQLPSSLRLPLHHICSRGHHQLTCLQHVTQDTPLELTNVEKNFLVLGKRAGVEVGQSIGQHVVLSSLGTHRKSKATRRRDICSTSSMSTQHKRNFDDNNSFTTNSFPRLSVAPVSEMCPTMSFKS